MGIRKRTISLFSSPEMIRVRGRRRKILDREAFI